MCIIAGDEGRRIETLTHEFIKDEIQDILQTVFCEKLKERCPNLPKNADLA